MRIQEKKWRENEVFKEWCREKLKICQFLTVSFAIGAKFGLPVNIIMASGSYLSEYFSDQFFIF